MNLRIDPFQQASSLKLDFCRVPKEGQVECASESIGLGGGGWFERLNISSLSERPESINFFRTHFKYFSLHIFFLKISEYTFKFVFRYEKCIF